MNADAQAKATHTPRPGAAESAPIVTFDTVWFRYPGTDEDEWALQDLTFSLTAGENLVVVGESGSGKSTLARLSCGLLAPDRGVVRVAGYDVADGESIVAVHTACGYVFQNPDDQLVASQVEDEVAFGPANLGLPRDEIAIRVERALAAVGLSDFGARQVDALSGGQKQRLAIAGVLALEPRALILDESSSMLDPRGRRDLAQLLNRLRAQGIATVSVSHFMEDALAADTVLALHQGRTAYYGPPQGLFADADLLRQLGLAEPFVVQMGRLLAEQGTTLPFCHSIDELAQACLAARDGASATNPMPTRPNGRSAAAQSERQFPATGAATLRPADAAAHSNEDHGQKPAIVTLREVAYSYSQATHFDASSDDVAEGMALQGVSLALPAGDLIGIAGSTGSGKSTLLQVAAGLLPPLNGTVTYAENAGESAPTEPVADRGDRSGLRKKRPFRRWHNRASHPFRNRTSDGRPVVGLVFQYPERQLFAQTVIDDVMFGPRNLGRGAEEARVDAQWALETVGLDAPLWERSPFNLSGGEQRRAALAGVLAMRPAVLALDEPTAGQDPARRAELIELIERLSAEGMGILLVSHDMELLACCDHLVVLHQGRIALQGAPLHVFRNTDELTACGLEPPAAIRFAAMLRQAGVSLPVTLNLKDIVAALFRAM